MFCSLIVSAFLDFLKLAPELLNRVSKQNKSLVGVRRFSRITDEAANQTSAAQKQTFHIILKQLVQLNTNYPLRVSFPERGPLTPPLPPCTLPPSVFAVASLTPLRVLQRGHQTLVNSLCSRWNLQLQRCSRLLNTHTCTAVKTSKAIERGLSVKPDPVITIWSSTSDLSVGQYQSLLPAPAPGSRVTSSSSSSSSSPRPFSRTEALQSSRDPQGHCTYWNHSCLNINALYRCGIDHHVIFP